MSKPIRVLHIQGNLSISGGIQKWLLLLLDRFDSKEFSVDFLVFGEQDPAVRSYVEDRGGRLIFCPSPKRLFGFVHCFRQALSQFGPYDVLHTHSYTYSGLYVLLGKLGGVPVRIVHSHNVWDHLYGSLAPLRRIYNAVTGRLIRRFATGGIAVSEEAASIMFGVNWQSDPRWKVSPCGIDLTPFAVETSDATVRFELGIPVEALTVGHVGRFAPARNHRFLLEVFAEVCKRQPNARLLLIGDGSLRQEMVEYAGTLGISGSVIFLGVREDVARILKGAVDLFLFPSTEEGLGLAVVEAQLAGVPVLASEAIPPEAEVTPGGIVRMSLDSPVDKWAGRLLEMQRVRTLGEDLNAVESVRGTWLDIEYNVELLARFYREQCRKS